METKETKNCIKTYTEDPLPEVSIQGRSQDISKEGGRVTLSQIEGTHQIVMSTFMPCLKKVFKGAGFGHGHLRTLSPPIYVLAFHMWVYSCEKLGLRRG